MAKEHVLVSEREAGWTLLAFLKEKKPSHLSVKGIKRLVDTGRCSVNGKIETISTRTLKKGDRVEVEWGIVKIQKEIPAILYEDDYFLICNKPPGVVCDQGEFNLYFPGLTLVHRLDKETSGVLMLAKHALAFDTMVDLFKKHEVDKFYLGVVRGELKEEKGEITSFLSQKSIKGGVPKWGSGPKEKGKEAVTRFTCLERANGASLLQIELLTGRTHQIRVHFSEKGHPILGDHLYGHTPHPTIHPSRQLLHAHKVFFIHPFTKKKIVITAPIPEDFCQACQKLFDKRPDDQKRL